MPVKNDRDSDSKKSSDSELSDLFLVAAGEVALLCIQLLKSLPEPATALFNCSWPGASRQRKQALVLSKPGPEHFPTSVTEILNKVIRTEELFQL